ncbi:hypothetical protein K438DRAFT_1937521 [Mycena galopus ATCC 62051]|nr:hypothetical protein K438DRAFT_1937521 [Mycena galopus ATCC 62051]
MGSSCSVPILEFNHVSFHTGYKYIIFPPEETQLPRPQSLYITTPGMEEIADIYDQFLRSLRSRPSLICARLLIYEISATPIPPPDEDLVARLRCFLADGTRIAVQTPTYRWARDPLINIDGDYNIFNPTNRFPSTTSSTRITPPHISEGTNADGPKIWVLGQRRNILDHDYLYLQFRNEKHPLAFVNHNDCSCEQKVLSCSTSLLFDAEGQIANIIFATREETQ